MDEKDILIFILIQSLIISLAVPLIIRVVKPNRWYGFRTPKTLSNETVWYKANRFAGISMLVASILSICIFVFFGLTGRGSNSHTVLFVSVSPPLILSVLSSLIYLTKIKE